MSAARAPRVQRRRLLGIVNPIAGRGAHERLRTQLGELAARADVTIETRATERAGHAAELAGQARSQGFDAVICCGGDGTVNETINGLGAGGLPLVVVPAGTGNALAREIGAPHDPRGWAPALRAWRLRTRDLGRMQDDRLFACFVGAGFDAECVREYREVRTGAIHPLRYMLMMRGIMNRSIARADFSTLALTVDGAPAIDHGSYALVAISPVFGGPIRFIRDALPADGRFDLIALTARVSHLIVWRMLALGLFDWRPRQLQRAQGARVAIATSERVPYQVDGDFAGYLPIAMQIVPGGLTLVEPMRGAA
ncbi:MAG TPA: diacylglycerol kinase family protein [Polyangia bacterium]|nr:diacylglycerol kinase family protein [Polyangia bacterium]